MNVLIVDALAANEGRRKFSRDAIGVGPRLLAGICNKNNIDSKISRVEDLLEDEENAIIKEYDIFLISGMTVDEIAVNRIIKRIKENKETTFIALGGPIASDVGIFLKSSINLVVGGEGEYIADALIRSNFNVKSLMTDDNISIENQGSYFISSEKKWTNGHLEFEPSTHHIKDYPDYWFSKVYVETVRGCSNFYRGELVKKSGDCYPCRNCSEIKSIKSGECHRRIPPGCGFCSVPHVFGPSRSRSIESIEKEINDLLRNGVRRIILSAPGFLDFRRERQKNSLYSPSFPPANIEEIEKLLSRLAIIRDNQENFCSISIENVKPSLVTNEIAKIIGKYLPNTAISIGCETFDENHSKQIGRPSSPEEAISAAKFFKEEGLNSQIYLIHSLPGESVQSLEKTIKVVKRDLSEIVEKITVYKYLPLPKSPFTETKVSLPVDRHLIKSKREELKREIIDFNYRKKKEMLDSEIISIVAERDKVRKNTFICYPLFSGPAISVISKKNIIKKIVKVKINAVISDKLVAGEVIEILEEII